ncbi:MAG: hypothetical protein HQM15_07090 [Deltaproteobacteria bacterium]|nr:hypothetical protein [Deltaproteobacteria bacterium]
MNTKKQFFGRKHEMTLLKEEYEKPSASLVVMYGRRRVGKTRLITEFYTDKSLWRFDGLEAEPKLKQIRALLAQLSQLTANPLYTSVNCNDWIAFFKILDEAMAKKQHRLALFLDELPYMANRQQELISALKWAWDNLWQDKAHFSLVLCGSIASFMIHKVLRASALYGRISLEICLKPLSVPEVQQFFGTSFSLREICNLYMTCGGIPAYLQRFPKTKPLPQSIAQLSFCKDGYFVEEFDRLFKDVFLEEKIYKKIILTLAKNRDLKIPELVADLDISGGGGVSDYMDNLESAGFVKSIIPWDKSDDSKLLRYRLEDEYLFFFFKFIHPNLRKIRDNTHLQWGLDLLRSRTHMAWAALAFERLCLKHVPFIARALGIEPLIQNSGPYFRKADNVREGVQIDLMFVRHDPVITLCEIKYQEGLVGKGIIPEIERKVAILGKTSKRIEKVLITTMGMTKDLAESGYFSKVLLLEDLFE